MTINDLVAAKLRELGVTVRPTILGQPDPMPAVIAFMQAFAADPKAALGPTQARLITTTQGTLSDAKTKEAQAQKDLDDLGTIFP